MPSSILRACLPTLGLACACAMAAPLAAEHVQQQTYSPYRLTQATVFLPKTTWVPAEEGLYYRYRVVNTSGRRTPYPISTFGRADLRRDQDPSLTRIVCTEMSGGVGPRRMRAGAVREGTFRTLEWAMGPRISSAPHMIDDSVPRIPTAQIPLGRYWGGFSVLNRTHEPPGPSNYYGAAWSANGIGVVKQITILASTAANG